jgi:membrane protease YdiL (CAAX protease family)
MYVGTQVTGFHIPRGVGLLVVDSVFLATLIPLFRAGALRPVDVGLRRVPGARSVGLVALSLLVYSWGSGLWGALLHLPLRRELQLGIAHQDTLIVVLTGIAMAAVVPVVEEVFFRGVLYRALRNRLAIAPASVISSTLFAIGHTQYPLLVWPEVALFGVIACLLYEHAGSLLPGIAMHSFIDASGFERSLSGHNQIVTLVFIVLALILLARSATLRLRTGRGGQSPPSTHTPRGPRRKRKTRAAEAARG